MLDKNTIKEIVAEYKHMWEDEREDYALIRTKNRFLIYHKPTGEVDGTEFEEVNKLIWENMIAVGVEILDELPNE